MTTTNEIFYNFEDKNKQYITDVSKIILDNSKDLTQTIGDLRIYGTNSANILHKLKIHNVYGSKYQDHFFKLLEDNNYNKNEELKNTISALSYPIFNRLDENIINKYLNSPYINSIEHTDELDGFIIKSNLMEDIKFTFADHYFKNDKDITSIIYNGNLQNQCHNHVETLINHDKSLYAITALCEGMYNNATYYHSYCFNRYDNKVIDLCSNIVMNKEDYYATFKCEEVFKIEGRFLQEAVNIAKFYNSELSKKYDPIAATLFQQYIWENNLISPDKSIYSEEPKNNRLLMKNRYKPKQ